MTFHCTMYCVVMELPIQLQFNNRVKVHPSKQILSCLSKIKTAMASYTTKVPIKGEADKIITLLYNSGEQQ